MSRIAPAAFLVALMGCTYLQEGIFYSIEKEQFIPDAGASLPNDISITGLARLGDVTYVAARTLYRRADGASDWEPWRPAEWGEGFRHVLSVATLGSNLYVVVTNSEATSSNLLRFDGSAWASVTGSPAGRPIRLTPVVDPTGVASDLLVSVLKSDGTYDVHPVTGTTLGPALNLGGEISARPVQSAARTTGSDYFLNFGDGRLFHGTGLSTLSVLSVSFGADIGSVSTRTTFPVSGAVFVTLTNGRVAWSTTSPWTSWSFSNQHRRLENEEPVRLGPVWVISGIVVAGSESQGRMGGGLYEIVSDGSGGAVVRNPTEAITQVDNYNSTQLSRATVTAFLSVGAEVYVGTLGKGLFRLRADKRWIWE